jgi:hypothetical protein
MTATVAPHNIIDNFRKGDYVDIVGGGGGKGSVAHSRRSTMTGGGVRASDGGLFRKVVFRGGLGQCVKFSGKKI